MEFQETSIKRLCGFYVSDWHLVTMLLPYINKKVNEQVKIATILQKDITQNIVTLVEKLNLKNEEKILNINWSKNIKIEKSLKKLKKGEELIIFINGDYEFIEKENLRLDKYYQSHIIYNKIKIINCYDITKFDGNISEILDKHDKILNTSGEKEITEIFEDYKRKENKYAV